MEDLTHGKVTSSIYAFGFSESQVSYAFHLISKATQFHVSVFTLHVRRVMDYPVRISTPDSTGENLSDESEFLEGVKAILCSQKSIDIIRKLSQHT